MAGIKNIQATRFFGLLLAVFLAVSGSASPAFATFPGLNGRISFESDRDGDLEIYTLKPDGSDVVQLTNNSATDSSAYWSSDGTKLVFYSNRDGDDDIYVMNADGTNVVQLTNDLASDNLPSFSPDGKFITFTSNRDGDSEIFVMNSDGTNQTQYTFNTSSEAAPKYSPDGSKIIFQSNLAGNVELFTINADGSGLTNLTNNAGGDFNANWSPDGSKIVFNSNRLGGGSNHLYTMNADGTNQTQLTTGNTNSLPDYSPDGAHVLFRTSRDGNNELYAKDLTTLVETRLTNNPAAENVPRWQPLTISPTVNADTAPAVRSGDAVTVNVTGNDTDSYESLDPSTLSVVSVTNGTATANPDGTITYRSVLGWSGTAQVAYRVCSTANSALCSTGILSVAVSPAGQLAETGQDMPTIFGGAVALLGVSLIVLGYRRRTLSY